MVIGQDIGIVIHGEVRLDLESPDPARRLHYAGLGYEASVAAAQLGQAPVLYTQCEHSIYHMLIRRDLESRGVLVRPCRDGILASANEAGWEAGQGVEVTGPAAVVVDTAPGLRVLEEVVHRHRDDRIIFCLDPATPALEMLPVLEQAHTLVCAEGQAYELARAIIPGGGFGELAREIGVTCLVRGEHCSHFVSADGGHRAVIRQSTPLPHLAVCAAIMARDGESGAKKLARMLRWIREEMEDEPGGDLTCTLREMRRRAEEDLLTGLASRCHAEQILDVLVRQGGRGRGSLSAILIDLDHFKSINDTYGHAEGDRILKLVTGAISKAVSRKSDVVARWGGEEILVILPGTDLEPAARIARGILEQIRQIPHGLEGRGPVTASAGVGAHTPKESADAFLRRIDAALYRAKERGRDRVETTILPELVSANGGKSAAGGS